MLKVEYVSKYFLNANRRIDVLKAVSFEIPAGSSCALIGPSGSGKSTLLGICAGLDRPSAGRILIEEIEISKLSEDQRASIRNEKIGFVFQFFQLVPTLTALENVMVPGELGRRANVRKDALQLLERVGLKDRLEHYPWQLSGGEQQRVALARAYLNRPRVLFADEPTGNLDAENASMVEELLFELNSNHGCTLLIATHNLELAARARQSLVIKAGQIESTSGAA